jgi:hypothetical protein
MNTTSKPDETLRINTSFSPAQSLRAMLPNQSRTEELFVTLKELCLKARELLAYLGIFLLIYSVCYVTTYAFYDDYENLYHADTAGASSVMVAPVQNGRPIVAYLYELTFSVVHNLGELRYLRIISIIGIALCAWLVYLVLRRAGMSYWPAFLIPIVVFSLPSYQVTVAWSLSAFQPYAILLSGAAFLLAERAIASPLTRTFWLLLPLAALCELASMMMYQPAAMMLLFFCAIGIFAQQLGVAESLKRLGMYLGLIIAAIGLDDISLHALPAIILGKGSPDARTQLVQNIPGKVVWFFKQPLRMTLNLVFISPTTSRAILVGAFIGAGLFLYFKGSTGSRLFKLLVALSLLPISYLPNLVTVDNFAAIRYLVAIGSLIALYFALAIIGFASLLDYVSLQQIKGAVIAIPLALSAIAGGVLAAHNVATEFAIPQYLELTLLNSQLQPVRQQHPYTIYFVTSSVSDSTAPIVLYDEFGLPSSIKWWNAAPMVYLTLQQSDPADKYVQVQVIQESDIKNLPTGSIVIDMHKLRSERL